jgi:hypothetical protein
VAFIAAARAQGSAAVIFGGLDVFGANDRKQFVPHQLMQRLTERQEPSFVRALAKKVDGKS